MRLIPRLWLFALALFVAAPLALETVGCGKDEESAAETAEDDDESAVELSEDDDESEEANDSDDEAEASDEAAEGADETSARGSTGETEADEGQEVAGEDEAGDEPKVGPRKRGDKARDRVRASRDAKTDDTPSKVKTASTSAADEEEVSKGKGELLSPADRRKAERERRIVELKRRNEERRKERMAKVDEQRREAESVSRQPVSAPAPRVAIRSVLSGMDLTKYITQADVRKIVSNDTLVQEGGLSGIEPSDRYNSVYFALPVRSSFGISVQVWRDKTRRDANTRFRRMRAQYANAEDSTAPTAKSFFSQWDEILMLSFADLTKRTVVSVSCSAKICKPKQLMALAEFISGKI
ncbi:MAG: hypothetical protein QF464_03435 [Myxococcota bacterium]|jgi:hypothetical protein|nr:hypothetical protein [Myxococcota bacterium]